MKNTLKNLLGNPKDGDKTTEVSGIYEIGYKDCELVGQTKRAVETRCQEHLAELRCGTIDKSCIAQHIWANNHHVDKENLKLIKNVKQSRQLDAYESIYISLEI